MRVEDNIHFEVTDNFIPIKSDGINTLRMTKNELDKLKMSKRRLDRRLNAYALNPTMNEHTIFNYVAYLAHRAMLEFSDDSINNNFTELLDNGYMPILALPTFMKSDAGVNILAKIEAVGLPILRHRAKKLDGQNLEVGEDIWVSKLDVQRIFGIHPRKVTSTDVLWAIMEKTR
jgi:hypothetical protein